MEEEDNILEGIVDNVEEDDDESLSDVEDDDVVVPFCSRFRFS